MLSRICPVKYMRTPIVLPDRGLQEDTPWAK